MPNHKSKCPNCGKTNVVEHHSPAKVKCKFCHKAYYRKSRPHSQESHTCF